MTLAVKICGVNSTEAMGAAIDGGAAFVGLMFYPPSPRYLATTEQASALAQMVPASIKRVGVFVDADDDFIAARIPVGLDALQLHGAETPERARQLKDRFGLPVIKAVKLATPDDLQAATTYDNAADIILFDAKPPADMAGALPGGNAISFDWTLLAGWQGKTPWMLSGGLGADNLAEAVRITGAAMVDVSSGVESAPGVKDPAKIKAFLDAARAL